MISFMISVVPPKIAMTSVVSVDSRVSLGFLPLTKKIWPAIRPLSWAALARSAAGKRVSSGRNGREPFPAREPLLLPGRAPVSLEVR